MLKSKVLVLNADLNSFLLNYDIPNPNIFRSGEQYPKLMHDGIKGFLDNVPKSDEIDIIYD